MSLCPCGSNLELAECCGPILSGMRPAPTAESLMRARYAAFATCQFDFLTESLHPDHRADHDAAATRRWAENSQWQGLDIISLEAGREDDHQGMVEFVATFKEKSTVKRHREKSRFQKLDDGRWYFVDGEMVLPKTEVHYTPKTGRNEPCPCGSGKKYKKCCGR